MKFKHNVLFFLIIFVFLLSAFTPTNSAMIPVTSSSMSADFASINLPRLSEFIPSVKNPGTAALTGIYIPNNSALSVIQQPASNPAYVSENPETITQFSLATQYGTIGLLAHDFLAGKNFSDLQLNDVVMLVHGNGRMELFQIDEIRKFKALSPLSPYSNFTEYEISDNVLTSTDLFNLTYGKGDGRVVFQTCISTPEQSSWGRIFVMGHKIDPIAKLTSFSSKITPDSAIYVGLDSFTATLAMY